MPNLGNAWHIPGNPEPRGRGAMRDPVGAIVPGTTITIFSGNQFQGPGNPGNQLQTGSSVFFKRAADATWTELPMKFFREDRNRNNKYYSATISADISSTFQVGEVIQYYLRIAYDDHDTTFLHANGNTSTPTADEAAAQAAPFTFTFESGAVRGQWGPVFDLPNVAIHTSVLPDRRVLMWGRREESNPSLDVHSCTPFIWNPETEKVMSPDQPRREPTPDNPETTVNLFCSGHAFLPDGRLLVVGGHLDDGNGSNQASIFDFRDGSWTPTRTMSTGRWYPTATTLEDGSVLVLGGSYWPAGNPPSVQNDVPEVWKNDAWTQLREFLPGGIARGDLELYPRTHLASDGRVFMSGPLMRSYFLDTKSGGRWEESALRGLRQCDYCPAVMYDKDKVLYIGGGGGNGNPPTNEAEIIDLGETPPRWRATGAMHFPRRQHNAILLPDGTVLVTGGTQGGGGPDPGRPNDTGFNDLRRGQPVHVAELWNPATGEWTQLAAEEVDRCYHSTAVLLPDARVLSAGGGEYRPYDSLGDNRPNDAQDSHRDAQIFSPPYLFKGARPVITRASTSVSYGETFEVDTAQPDEIDKVRWIRLPSVTHAFDQSQRINVLDHQVVAGKLQVTAPDSPKVCPPGHYMLFILNSAGVPSGAWIIQMQPDPALARELVTASPEVAERGAYGDVPARRAAVATAARGTRVVVGITGTCPYGIAACWGGAHEALYSLESVDLVNPVPNADDSTAEVFLQDEALPAIDRWEKQFGSIVNGRYVLRGVEVTLQGAVDARDGQLFLAASGQRPRVQLAPLAAADIIQWNRAAGTPKPLEAGEDPAYERLVAASRDLPDGQQVTVTGPLKQTDAGYQLHVRLFEI